MSEQKPRRVLVVVSNKNPLWEQAWSASEDTCKAALEILKSNHLLEHNDPTSIRLLAKTNWGTRVFIVFDIANVSYDPATGHLPEQNNLPVSIVHLSGRVKAYPAGPPAQSRVNNEIARIHNLNGIGSVPPFVTDYALGPPTYYNPRDPSLL